MSEGYFSEEYDDDQRYKDNEAKICPYRGNVYDKRYQVIEFDNKMQLIKDPIKYDMDLKKKSVWSLTEIEIFLKEYLDNPK